MSKVPEQTKVWTVLELIRWGTTYFGQKGIESGRLTMELLLCEVLATRRIALYSDFERPLMPQELVQLRGYVQRIANHEPLQYVLGKADFFSLQFEVTPDVLIPRQETEILVERVISQVADRKTCLDIGTGSGIIAVAIAKHVPQSQWLCIDKSSGAVDVARRNADRHGVADQCTFQVMDILTQAPSQTFDIICMNPPYIAASEVSTLDATVRDYEPHSALTDDADGLSFYRRLSHLGESLLNPNGLMVFELGWGQAESAVDLFKGRWNTRVINDLADIPRVLEVWSN